MDPGHVLNKHGQKSDPLMADVCVSFYWKWQGADGLVVNRLKNKILWRGNFAYWKSTCEAGLIMSLVGFAKFLNWVSTDSTG